MQAHGLFKAGVALSPPVVAENAITCLGSKPVAHCLFKQHSRALGSLQRMQIIPKRPYVLFLPRHIVAQEKRLR